MLNFNEKAQRKGDLAVSVATLQSVFKKIGVKSAKQNSSCIMSDKYQMGSKENYAKIA